jgi:cellulose synthase/poly-beta-1,6-N-acetylglucosamine synthase-like glycosyltransferase
MSFVEETNAMSFMHYAFWFCAFVVIYVYLGYPALLVLGVFGRRKTTRRAGIQPTVSVLIPAHNEEKVIRAKMLNALRQSYPAEKMEILVGNDGSQDATAAIVASMKPCAVILVNSDVPRGKSSIQNMLVENSHGEILVFTDADCFLPSSALSTLVQNFADPAVGLVTNCVAISNRNETSVVESEGLYWKYERWLRLQESDRGLLAMASGSLFAMRRELWSPLEANVGDDFALPLRVARAGFRNVLETRVCAETVLSQNEPHSMFRMKMRVISKDLRGLLRNPSCLNPFRVGSVGIGLLSHKLLRWAIPYFLIGLFVSNLFLATNVIWRTFLAAQAVFYGLSALALLFGGKRLQFPLSAAASFCLVNLAALFGTLHCLTSQPAGQWKPVR